MIDLVGVVFSVANTLILLGGVVLTLYGQYYFREGILVKTLKRGFVVTVIMFVHFFLNTLNELSILAVPGVVSDVLEFSFTVGLGYLAYAFIRDWKTIG